MATAKKKRPPKKKTEKEIKKDVGIRTQELLPRKLSRTEMDGYSRSATEIHQEIQWEEAELSAIQKERKARIQKLKKNFNETMDVMREGRVWEPISCFKKVVGNTVVFYSDQGEEIHTRPATDTDRQVEMFAREGEQVEAATA